jgi:hypothetical protein
VKALIGTLAFAALTQTAFSVNAAPAKAEASAEPAQGTDYGHSGQFGARAAIAAGYRMVLRYDDSPFCAEPDPSEPLSDAQKFCGHGAPAALDFALSYAPVDFAEPFLWFRLGLSGEDQTKTDPVRIVGAGVRVYTMSDSQIKIFVEPAIGLEFEQGSPEGLWLSNKAEYEQDLVFHVAAGPQFDLAHNFGLFLAGGITIGVLRAIHSSLELTAGLELRVP